MHNDKLQLQKNLLNLPPFKLRNLMPCTRRNKQRWFHYKLNQVRSKMKTISLKNVKISFLTFLSLKFKSN